MSIANSRYGHGDRSGISDRTAVLDLGSWFQISTRTRGVALLVSCHQVEHESTEKGAVNAPLMQYRRKNEPKQTSVFSDCLRIA
ncbi:MAG: hypothetical protein C0629_09515 [Chromatiales bacterium]|nr:MAG: hypothetical protein C0629_09515 [Chromatiales bacterium]